MPMWAELLLLIKKEFFPSGKGAHEYNVHTPHRGCVDIGALLK